MNSTYLYLESLYLIHLTFSFLLHIYIPSWKSFLFAEFLPYLTIFIVLRIQHRLQQGTIFEKDPWTQARMFAETYFNKEQIFINMMFSTVAYLEVPATYQKWYN